MRFVPYPEGATGKAMTGYSTTGPFERTYIYSQVAGLVAKEFFL